MSDEDEPLNDEEVAAKRDETLKRMIATPPKSHKDEPKRRPSPTPIGKLIAKGGTSKKRDKA